MVQEDLPDQLVEEIAAWLAECGWTFTGHRPLAGPISLVTAEAV